MSVGYRAISWNRQKRLYDGVLVAGIGVHLALFVGAGLVLHPNATAETLLIRAFGTGAFLALHVALCIGPLARLDRRFLPLLYNRRHLGVATCLLALAHGSLGLFQFHALGTLNPFVSLFTFAPGFGGLAQLPFQPLGAAALVILLLMAATSHDYWLASLSAPRWKRLHLLVYPAFALVELHVVLGVLQAETSPWLVLVLALGLSLVLGLHLAAAWKGAALDRPRDGEADGDGWVDVCAVDEIPEGRARIVTLSGERIALFRYADEKGGKLSALSNVCQHQNGPLGEGRIVDGLVVCPWHGYQYRPDCGRSPEPFTERVPTFRTKVVGGRALVDPRPLPAGTTVEPARIDASSGSEPADGALFVGYLPRMAPELARFLRLRIGIALVALGLVSLTLAAAQSGFAPADFEYGIVRSFEGRLERLPHPVLLVERPGDGPASWLVVGQGKHGADGELAPLAGRRVRLEGSLIFREGRTLLELAPGTAVALEEPPGEAPPTEDLGVHTLVGEIVDSKCFFGVMNPGELKAHQACAMRCIAGGIPPILIARDPSGASLQLLLVGADGEAVNERVLARVAEPVEITGRVLRHGDLLVLWADPAGYREPR